MWVYQPANIAAHMAPNNELHYLFCCRRGVIMQDLAASILKQLSNITG